MRGFGVFLGKEAREILRTWRIWALPGLVVFLALTGPVIAKLTPELLKSMSGTAGMGGVVVTLPKPTWQDAYLQWSKNLTQMITWVLVVMAGGMVSGERKSGTAVLVLTKPISRSAFLLAKFISNAGLVALAAVLGAFSTWAVTLGVFGEAPVRIMVEATAVWLTFAIVLVAVLTLFSAVVDSRLGATFLGFGVLVAFTIASLWGPAADLSPAGLVNAPNAVISGTGGRLLWPLVTSAVATLLFVAGGMCAFSRKEL
ncbi:MAG: ABC transporter permease [Actinomycetia bacterium]|nr:ABC transporter permease [Actinomycetes bacterium]